MDFDIGYSDGRYRRGIDFFWRIIICGYIEEGIELDVEG